MKSITWKSPSNIALVKYWGKKGLQLPSNPSVSFTLNDCHTVTRMSYQEKEDDGTLLVSFTLDGERKPEFEPKLSQFFENTEHLFPFLGKYHIEIDTTNTFPHSSGIASSASGMSALALCLCSVEKEVNPNFDESTFFTKASIAARLGSGSACRSVFGPACLWGSSPFLDGSSDEFAVKLDKIHSVFTNYHDTILLVDEGQKEVSSSLGHSLLKNHPFAETRFAEANKNIGLILDALKNGDLELFNQVTENEALMLHAMMMTSQPGFILMRPNSVAIIQAVWQHRKSSGLNMTITLDAGANIHLLYPDAEKAKVQEFITHELLQYCQDAKVIYDKVGLGPEQF